MRSVPARAPRTVDPGLAALQAACAQGTWCIRRRNGQTQLRGRCWVSPDLSEWLNLTTFEHASVTAHDSFPVTTGGRVGEIRLGTCQALFYCSSVAARRPAYRELPLCAFAAPERVLEQLVQSLGLTVTAEV